MLIDELRERIHEHRRLGHSKTAIDANWSRLGKASELVRRLVADIPRVELEPAAYDVWHDRAVFHFPAAANDRGAMSGGLPVP